MTENKKFWIGAVLVPILVAIGGWPWIIEWIDCFRCDYNGVELELNYRKGQAQLVNIIEKDLRDCCGASVRSERKEYDVKPNMRWYWTEDETLADKLKDRINDAISTTPYKEIRVELKDHRSRREDHKRKEFHVYL